MAKKYKSKTVADHILEAEQHLKAALSILGPSQSFCLCKAEGFIEMIMPGISAAYDYCKDEEDDQ